MLQLSPPPVTHRVSQNSFDRWTEFKLNLLLILPSSPLLAPFRWLQQESSMNTYISDAVAGVLFILRILQLDGLGHPLPILVHLLKEMRVAGSLLHNLTVEDATLTKSNSKTQGQEWNNALHRFFIALFCSAETCTSATEELEQPIFLLPMLQSIDELGRFPSCGIMGHQFAALKFAGYRVVGGF